MNSPPRPDDLIPVGVMVKLGPTGVRAIISEQIYDQHVLGGWGYRMKYEGGVGSPGGFLWPHGAPSGSHSHITFLSPLETLAREAE